jgi:hypothetical protein
LEKSVSELAAINTKQLLDTMAKVGDAPLGLGNAADLIGKSRTFEYTFEYLDFIFAVKASAEDDKTHMRFHANLGHIPFTSQNPGGRANAIQILHTAGSLLGGSVHISPRQRILLTEEFWYETPLTPTLLMTKTVELLLRAKPYLLLLADSVTKPVQHAGYTSQR